MRHIDGKGYKAYNDIIGTFEYASGIQLFVDHVQSDPFAPPSKARVRVPMTVASLPSELYGNVSSFPNQRGEPVAVSPRIRNLAACDYLTRIFYSCCRNGGFDVKAGGGGWSGPKGGSFTIDCPGQHVLQRNSVVITEEYVEARFTISLPARGRTILGQWAHEILVDHVPLVANAALVHSSLPHGGAGLREHVLSVEDQAYLRACLRPAGLVSFVCDGAVLPRSSGANDTPMKGDSVIPFKSPASLETSFTLPNRGQVTGMGIRHGITLIVGGGFHGKSTLLQALELGVFDHLPGDGREFVVTDETAVKVRAEDGRCISSVDISPFINNLPYRIDTTSFSSGDASGSTSQAAGIVEALEVGSTVLLVDEDTCATNFMIRDRRMQMLVSKDKEPITPFISKIRALYEDKGVSSVLVIGGVGDYFGVADTVIMMDAYAPVDVTERAREIAAEFDAAESAQKLHGSLGVNPLVPPSGVKREVEEEKSEAELFGDPRQRVPDYSRVECGDRVKVKQSGVDKIVYDREEIDLVCVEQIADASQTRAIGDCILFLARRGRVSSSLSAELAELDTLFDGANGLDVLCGSRLHGCYARPRRFEVAAALNRFRSMSFGQL